jgi:hypothetical protein
MTWHECKTIRVGAHFRFWAREWWVRFVVVAVRLYEEAACGCRVEPSRTVQSGQVLRDGLHCASVSLLLFVSYRNQQFTFLPGRIAGYENVIQVRHCVPSYTMTALCEALITYCTNIDRISVMCFIEPVKCGCG